MATKTEKTTPFQSGQQTNAKGKSESVPVKSNMSRVKNSGRGDALHSALGHRDSYIPSDNHIVHHTTTVTPMGAHYSPAGEFGTLSGGSGYKATGMSSHTSAPGDNALGMMMNKVGEKSGYPKGGKKRGGGGKHV